MHKKTLYFLLIFLSGCYPRIDHRGFNPENVDFNKIIVNQTTQNELINIVGSPTIVSDFPMNSKKWKCLYYVQTITKTVSFFNPKVQKHLIITIIVDENDIVKDVIINDKAKIKKIKLDKNRTKSTGYQTSLSRDIFGNFTKYAQKEDK